MTKKIEITVSPTRISNNSENRRETRVTDEWTPTRQHARMVVRVSLIGKSKLKYEHNPRRGESWARCVEKMRRAGAGLKKYTTRCTRPITITILDDSSLRHFLIRVRIFDKYLRRVPSRRWQIFKTSYIRIEIRDTKV